MALKFLSPFLLAAICSRSALAAENASRDAQYLGNEGVAFETEQHADPLLSFYHVPSNFSSNLAPGSLLHVEPVTNLSNYTVPSSLTMSRIIYTTTSLNKTTIATSAYILWPYATASEVQNATGTSNSANSGYPLVAWAHGTSGLLPHCAVSNYRSLQYHFQVPFLLALQGMAVVAPDYAGLGISSLPSGEQIRHPWLGGPAQANDLANAVTAARTAFPRLLPANGSFVAMGHSQGGKAAWSFAERQSGNPLAGYRGTVAIAPPYNEVSMVEAAMKNTSAFWSATVQGSSVMYIAGVTAQFPAYNYSGMSDESYYRWNDVLVPLDGCFPTSGLLFEDVPLSQQTKPGWQSNPTVQRYANIAAAGERPFAGPLLIISGSADQVVPNDLLRPVVEQTCEMYGKNQSLEFATYVGVNHFPSIQASSMKWLPWIKQKLAAGGDASSSNGCVQETVTGFRTADYSDQGPFPNFLDVWVPSSQSWKGML